MKRLAHFLLLAACCAAPAAARAEFSAGRAWKHLKRQVRFGPRVPNTRGHRACRAYLEARLRATADRVERQDFSYDLGRRTLRMSNLIARWSGPPGASGGVLLCAHWDTRPTADREAESERRTRPIPGANDGASGVAVLLEVARALKRRPPPVPVMLVLFDGEDYGPGLDRMLLGSRHFAARLPADTPRQGVLLDMIGDKSLRVPQEGFSRRSARGVLDEVYAVAGRLGHRRHFPLVPGQEIYDDHVPLQNRGLQVIDLIDFNYGPDNSWWHTLQDTPSKCSRRSLRVVGEVVLGWVRSRE